MIRLATYADAEAIARVHVDSWTHAFSQFAPEIVKARGDQYPKRLETWQAILKNSESFVYVTTDEADKIVGMAQGGAVRKELDLSDSGELMRLYVSPTAIRRGIGKKLINQIATRLQKEGHRALVVVAWAINQPARAIYEHLGAQFVKIIPQQHGEFDTSQAVYSWDDIQTVIEATQSP